MADWEPKQYLKFSGERTQPAVDLANRVDIVKPGKILDIGCGPGNSTAALKRRYPNARILGIDNSNNMIEAAKRDHPDLDFMLCDANIELHKLDNDWDIVFSNACIQWLPDHYRLLPEMMHLLRESGILAVQTPMNYQEPIHKIIGEVSESAKWKAYFANPRIFYNLTEEEYFVLLSEISVEFSMWKTTYFHRLKSHNEIIEWYRGTGLRPYLNALPSNLKIEFEREVYSKVVKFYPIQKNGLIIFRFPRLFFTAVK